MKLTVGIFFGGLFGALGILTFLVAFGTDYWLLAKEVDKCSGNKSNGGVDRVLLHHEGFFWRCWFNGDVGPDNNTMTAFWIIFCNCLQANPVNPIANQAPTKNCTHAYLSPFPRSIDNNNSTAYHSAVVYRGFWNIFMLLGVVTVIAGGFFIICAAPFTNYRLYKAGGGLFITAGIFFTLVVVMHVIWVQSVSDVKSYEDMRKEDCPGYAADIRYGWSFMLAPFGIFFSLLAGMLFLLVGHTILRHTK